MKILVSVKRVVDHNVKVRVKSDGSGVADDGLVDDLFTAVPELVSSLEATAK
jgi:hypothetical protein